MQLEQQAAGARRYTEMMRAEGLESISGPGSSLVNTWAVRKWLTEIITDFGFRSIADIPCGDQFWISHMDLSGIEYAGYDLLYNQFNAITEVPPRADLILCRDLLPHLTLEHGCKVLNNFKASSSKFLAITSFPDVTVNQELRESHAGWGWRKLNMSEPPFNMSGPLEYVAEDEGQGKTLALYRINP